MKERRGSDRNWPASRITRQVSLLVLCTEEDPCFLWCQWKPVCVRAQSCLTLCNLIDCSPPGSSARGILQARILEWVVISFSGDLPNPGTEPASPTLAGGFSATEPPGKPWKAACTVVKRVPCEVGLTGFKSPSVTGKFHLHASISLSANIGMMPYMIVTGNNWANTY